MYMIITFTAIDPVALPIKWFFRKMLASISAMQHVITRFAKNKIGTFITRNNVIVQRFLLICTTSGIGATEENVRFRAPFYLVVIKTAEHSIIASASIG